VPVRSGYLYPVRIPLVCGMTATVTIRVLGRVKAFADHLLTIIRVPQPSPAACPRIGDENGATVPFPHQTRRSCQFLKNSTPSSRPAWNKSPRARLTARLTISRYGIDDGETAIGGLAIRLIETWLAAIFRTRLSLVHPEFRDELR